MSKRSQFALALSPALVLAIAASAAAAPPANASVEAARLATYETPSGETYFALSLVPKVAVDLAQPHDVVVLFDTSASQAGPYRSDALVALNSFLSGLSQDDRVMLLAVDMKAVPMTAKFAAPGSPEMAAGLAKLQQRAPLGATDMGEGLRGALANVDGAAPSTVVYIGDGMSKAGTFTTESFGDIVSELSRKRVSVSSFVIGQEQNAQLLATLANHTGGFLQMDNNDPQSATNGGQVLAGSINSTVVWPEQVSLPKSMVEAYPMPVPPLRTDRDTVLIGRLDSNDPAEISLTANVAGKPITLAWSATTEKPSEDFAFLPKLVGQAQADKGLSLPTVGSAGLREAAVVTMASAENLVKLGHEALASGNAQGARAAADAALQRDPRNPTAIALRDAALSGVAAPANLPPVGNAAPAAGARPVRGGGEADLTLVAPAAADAPIAGSLLAEELAEGSILPPTIQEELLISQRIQAEVANGLNAARDIMAENPDTAEQDLKLLLENVERAPRLSAEVRRQLRDQIEFAIRESRRLSVEFAENKARTEEARAGALELLRINQDLVVREQRLKQIMDRFNSLMAEGRYEVADQEVIPEIANMAPGTILASSVTTGGRLEKNVREIVAIFERKERAFVDTMYQVELSHIPFPDEPPIVYPAADVWEDLTIRRKKYASVDLARRGGSEERIFKALNENTQLEFVETPLKDIVDYLSTYHEIPIVINAKKLEEAAVAIDTPVTKNLKGISLRSALRLMLAELELTYLIDDEVLQITTPDDANSPERLTTKVYPVGDLVLPIGINNSLFGLGGQGGQNGMGGQGGGFGGGMNGGGMGGGGFGGGGMGGGGMGGGFFDVQDDLSIGTKKKPTPVAKPAPVAKPQPESAKPEAQSSAKPAAKSAPKSTVRAIEIASDGGSQDWDTYLADQRKTIDSAKDSNAANAAALASIRETVRQQMSKKQYNDVSNLIQASLRNGFVESWMYEAIGLAMQAANASQDDLERALLSAVDFAQSEDEVLVIAAYMTKSGLHSRALKLFRQVADSSPSRPQPYIQGLALAQRLDDIDAIQWSCVGLLRQAWPDDQREIGENAYRVAKATYERLLAEGRKDDAASFDAAIRKSVERDCVVRVTWTGQADVDVTVEEPSGTVCTLRNPRTTAGGVLLGDASSADKGATAEGYSETYVCGEAFSGDYRVLIRNIWGKPTSGKVTIDIYKHYNTKKQELIHQQIPLGDKNALVLFNLDDGRRAEPLAEAQVAQVAKIQNDVNRAVLAQQLAGLDNAAAALRYAAAMGLLNGSSGSGGGTGTGTGGGVVPADFFRRGAVGYRPVITALPEGANFSSNAVISADRRYVRVSPSPTFSQVTEVSTFNFVTGSGTTQQQPGAGGGGGLGGAF
jgi:uncharacterized membrane protein YgcG